LFFHLQVHYQLTIKIAVAVAAFAAMLFLGACAPQRTVEIRTQMTSDELKPFVGSGSGTVVGQGFLRQQGGGVVTCAAATVYLVPEVPYTRERIGLLLRGQNPEPPAINVDDRLNAVRRETICDAQGRFRFNQIPPGDWFAITSVGWIVGGVQQGGGLYKAVAVRPSHETEVLMTDRDRFGAHQSR
jgi:hypothetical protein